MSLEARPKAAESVHLDVNVKMDPNDDIFAQVEEEIRPFGHYIPRRYILAFLTFFALMFSTIIRNSFSVAVVPISEEKGWDEQVKGMALSAFYWGYLATQLLGGFLSGFIGFKSVIVAGAVGSALFTVLLPLVAFSFPIFVTMRALAGLSQGVIIPAVYHLVSEWYPKNEKTIFSSLITSGDEWGTVLAMSVSPLVVEAFGWRGLLFGSGGFILLVWWAPWLFIVHSTPDLSKNSGSLQRSCLPIHPIEAEYILKNRDKGDEERRIRARNLLIENGMLDPSEVVVPMNRNPLQYFISIPWKTILFDRSTIAIYAHTFCGGWGWYIFTSWLPTYFEKVLHYDLKHAGFLSFAPYLFKPVLSIISGFFVDFAAHRGWMTLQRARKVTLSISTLGPAIGFVLLALLPPDPQVCAIAVGGVEGGVKGNEIDLSPKYAAILVGVAKTVGAIPGMIGVYLTGWLLSVTHGDWSIIFFFVAGMHIVSAVVYGILGRARLVDFENKGSVEDSTKLLLATAKSPLSEQTPLKAQSNDYGSNAIASPLL